MHRSDKEVLGYGVLLQSLRKKDSRSPKEFTEWMNLLMKTPDAPLSPQDLAAIEEGKAPVPVKLVRAAQHFLDKSLADNADAKEQQAQFLRAGHAVEEATRRHGDWVRHARSNADTHLPPAFVEAAASLASFFKDFSPAEIKAGIRGIGPKKLDALHACHPGLKGLDFGHLRFFLEKRGIITRAGERILPIEGAENNFNTACETYKRAAKHAEALQGVAL